MIGEKGRSPLTPRLGAWLASAATLRSWREEVRLTLELRLTGERHSNGMAENLDGRMATFIKNSCGLPSFERARRRLLLLFG